MKSIILKEFKHHGPYTFSGAFLGVVIVFALQALAPGTLGTHSAEMVFEITHPLHVVLSAMVTAALYKNYQGRPNHAKGALLAFILIGYFGSIGIATLSDCLVPYWAELLIGMHHAHAHLGIVEMPIVINLSALVGIAIAFFLRNTHFPHGGHVMLSTAASLAHIVQAADGEPFTLVRGIFVVLFLFLAVWVPCCLSDIAFPMAFAHAKHS